MMDDTGRRATIEETEDIVDTELINGVYRQELRQVDRRKNHSRYHGYERRSGIDRRVKKIREVI